MIQMYSPGERFTLKNEQQQPEKQLKFEFSVPRVTGISN